MSGHKKWSEIKHKRSRLSTREPYSIPGGELDGLDDVDIAHLQKANDGELSVPDNELTPDELAYVQRWRKAHD